MIYAIIWFGGAWVYWLVWAIIWMFGIHAPAGVLVFLLTKLPAIIVTIDVIASVLVYRKKKSDTATQKEEYNRKEHIGTLAKITVGVIVTLMAYICLALSIAGSIFNAH